MIFYFSGTGNSLYIAKKIAESQKEEIISISSEMNSHKECYEYNFKEGEKIIFIYPIYAWAPPKRVIEFVRKLKFYNYKENYISSIATCGKNIGNAMKYFKKVLKDKDLVLNSGFSMVMPNNYMLQGNVDTEDIINNKMEDSLKLIKEINSIINNKQKDIFKITTGHMPFVTTSIINPLFNKNMINTKKFTVTEDCTSCGLCEKVCNNKCIKVDKIPTWGEDCSLCLACINYCLAEAIQYGNSTKNKVRYRNLKISIEEMNI